MIDWIVLLIFSFLPPIIYTIWIRNTEKCNREKWKIIFFCFLWGASIAIIASIILEYILQISLVGSINDYSLFSLITVAVIAPVVEEFTKPLALRTKTVRKEIDELEDGLIYGAVAGLGFSATENLFYGIEFMKYGILLFLALIIIRSIGACILHASATALTGYGYGKTIMQKTSIIRVLPYFFIAILMHSFYNFVLTYELIGAAIGLLIALAFVWFSITWVRNKIKELDKLTC